VIENNLSKGLLKSILKSVIARKQGGKYAQAYKVMAGSRTGNLLIKNFVYR